MHCSLLPCGSVVTRPHETHTEATVGEMGSFGFTLRMKVAIDVPAKWPRQPSLLPQDSGQGQKIVWLILAGGKRDEAEMLIRENCFDHVGWVPGGRAAQ